MATDTFTSPRPAAADMLGDAVTLRDTEVDPVPLEEGVPVGVVRGEPVPLPLSLPVQLELDVEEGEPPADRVTLGLRLLERLEDKVRDGEIDARGLLLALGVSLRLGLEATVLLILCERLRDDVELLEGV